MIAESLETVGAARSIVIDETARILAGNATSRQALERGLKLKVVDVAGDTVVAVRRRGLTEEQKTALALYDNRAAELAEWDPAVLQALAADGLDLGPFWQDAELRQLLATLDFEKPGQTDPDDIPPVRRTSIQAGDLFALGDHRLLCGDSTSADDVARVMDGQRARLFATDPPYLVDYDGTNHPNAKGKFSKTRNKDWGEQYQDWDAAEQGQPFYEAFIRVALDHAIDERAAWYCWHASRRQAMLEAVWTAAGAFVHQQIIWAKTRATLTRSVYLWAHEPCLFGWLKGKKPLLRKAALEDGSHPTTVWHVPSSEVESKDHPTSKPVRLFSLPMLLHTDAGDVCYEPFSGSGTQIIAAEQTGRRCFAVEREPSFVQVAIDRWEAFTGQTARKVGAVPHTRRRPHRGRARQQA